MYILLNLKSYAQMKLSRFLAEENGEVNIVATVVLIGIAVLLAVFFKNQIMGLLTDLFDTIRGTATGAVTN